MNNTTSSPSTGYDLVQAAKNPIIYTFSIKTTFVLITNILNVCVLSRRALRLSACTYYFLASVPVVAIYVIVAPLNTILLNRYGLSINNTLFSCQLVQFKLIATPSLYGLILICASIDRFCSSSTSLRLLRFSQVRVPRRVIIIVWILTFIYMSPLLVIYYYDYASLSANKCLLYSTTLITVYLWTRVALYYFLIPAILGIFGSLTIYNIRSQTLRVAPVNQANTHRRTEGQLARMLIIQVATYFLFSTPSCVAYILVTFVPSMNTPYYVTIRTLAGVWQQGHFFISFFIYILSGKVYREELKKMFSWGQIHNKLAQLNVQGTVTALRPALPIDRT